MKRLLTVLMAAIMVIGLCACGQKSETAPEGPSWQEQYDLGIRYLSEGKYEEAILAFTAAIEIDPKRAEAYGKAAEAYEALGDIDGAISVLEQGFAETEDMFLADWLDRLKLSDSLPDIPELLSTQYEFGADLYIPATENLEVVFQEMIAAGTGGDWDSARALLESGQFIQEVQVAMAAEPESALVFWTMMGDSLLSLGYYPPDDGDAGMTKMEYRPLSGTAFCFRWSNHPTEGQWYYGSGPAEGFLWNGPFEKYAIDYWAEGIRYTDARGTAEHDLVHGEYIRHLTFDWNPDGENTYYSVYEHGLLQAAWWDEQAGMMATHKDVDVNGNISYAYASEEAMKEEQCAAGSW